MSEVLNLPSTLDVLDRGEVCVVGGGLAGVAAALTAAETGAETLLIEERGALGWEISHGLDFFLSPGTKVPRLLQCLLDELAAHNGFRDGILDPVATEIVLDRFVSAAKIKLHLRAFGGAVETAHGTLRLTTKSGPLAVQAKTFVDATATSRLAAKAGAKFDGAAAPERSRAFLLCAVTPPVAPITLQLEGVGAATVRPTLWKNEAHVRITCVPAYPETAEAAQRFAIARAIEALRKTQPGFDKASLSLSAHEDFALRVPRLAAASLPEGLSVAGPAVFGRHLTLEERAQLGEQASAAAVEQLRGAVAK